MDFSNTVDKFTAATFHGVEGIFEAFERVEAQWLILVRKGEVYCSFMGARDWGCCLFEGSEVA